MFSPMDYRYRHRLLPILDPVMYTQYHPSLVQSVPKSASHTSWFFLLPSCAYFCIIICNYIVFCTYCQLFATIFCLFLSSCINFVCAPFSFPHFSTLKSLNLSLIYGFFLKIKLFLLWFFENIPHINPYFFHQIK